MKKTIFLFLCCFFTPFYLFSQDIPIAPYLPAQHSASAKNAPISVQYPYENMRVTGGAKQIFLFGRVNVPEPVTSLDINGTQVAVSDNGGFIAYLPVETGTFEFVLTATTPSQTYQALRHVIIEGTDIRQYGKKAAFDKTSLFPQSTVELLPNDTVSLFARGTPGSKVTFSMAGIKGAKNIDMREDKNNPGNYRAQFTFSTEQKPRRAKVTYKLTAPSRKKAKAVAPAKIKVRDAKNPFTYARVTLDGVKLRKLPTSSGNLYAYYRAYGDVRVSGVMNNQYRLQLSDKESAWLEKKRLKNISAPDKDRVNILSDMHLETLDGRVRLRFDLTHKLPISIREFNDSLQLILYGVDDYEENFSFDTTNPLLDRVEWAKTADKTYTFIAWLKEPGTLWGHDYKFEGNTLYVDFIERPIIEPAWDKPLKGARIVIDAGHNPRLTVPYDGAIGPGGYLEFQATMALAEQLKTLLEKDGATVLMTRKGDNKMSLQQRYEYALKHNAHIFVSLHYNALPATTDPAAKPRGFTIFYTYPHSFELAQAMHDSFVKNVPLPDEGLTLNDVLFIPRISPMPSILVENAHLIIPEQEQMARTPAGQRIFVHALHEGILNFYNKQFPPPPKPKRKKFKKPTRIR